MSRADVITRRDSAVLSQKRVTMRAESSRLAAIINAVIPEAPFLKPLLQSIVPAVVLAAAVHQPGAPLAKAGVDDGIRPPPGVQKPIGSVRGITIGPIENSRHPNKGYGSDASNRSMRDAKHMGATWVSITPFGRVQNLRSKGIDLSFESPFEENRLSVLRAIQQAHSHGLKVMLVPHLWVESGEWRAHIDPGNEAAWQEWSDSYRRFLLTWA